ncbi:MAG: hypothetical protein HY343_10480 [Lentisphaerae bacterium]|nr:hypothetical protein [Lentisphaerota bacterium]
MMARWIEALVRTLAYGAISVGAAITHFLEQPAVSGFIVGFAIADMLTWAIFVAVRLPRFILAGAWEIVVNVAAGLVIFHFARFPTVLDDDTMVCGFVALLATLAVKSVYYSYQWLFKDEEDA